MQQRPLIFETAPICPLTAEEFVQVGTGVIAYVKTAKTGEVQRLLPQVEGLPADADLFLLVGADGTIIAVTDTRNAAVGHIVQNELLEVALH